MRLWLRLVNAVSRLQEDSIGLGHIRDRSRAKAEVDSELESPSSISSDTDSLKENHLCVTLAGRKPGYSTKVLFVCSGLSLLNK